MKQTLIVKFKAGTSTASEEHDLKRLLQSAPNDELTNEEKKILALLNYNLEDEEDIFAMDYTEEYEKQVRLHRVIPLCPWLAAACVVGIAFLFLTPPKSGITEETIAAKTEKITVEKKGTIIYEQNVTVSNFVAVNNTQKIVPENKTVQPSGVVQKKEVVAPVVTMPTIEPIIENNLVVSNNLSEQESATMFELNERDVPIRTANLKYTPEEITQLKRKASEAYEKWMELELEIAKLNLASTAQILEQLKQ